MRRYTPKDDPGPWVDPSDRSRSRSSSGPRPDRRGLRRSEPQQPITIRMGLPLDTNLSFPVPTWGNPTLGDDGVGAAGLVRGGSNPCAHPDQHPEDRANEARHSATESSLPRPGIEFSFDD